MSYLINMNGISLTLLTVYLENALMVLETKCPCCGQLDNDTQKTVDTTIPTLHQSLNLHQTYEDKDGGTSSVSSSDSDIQIVEFPTLYIFNTGQPISSCH